MAEAAPELALAAICRELVRLGRLARITSRGYAREQDLEAKLALVLHDVGYSTG